MEELLKSFESQCAKAESDLQEGSKLLQLQAEEKFKKVDPKLSPFELLKRLERIQKNLPALSQKCDKIVHAKNELYECSQIIEETRQIWSRIQLSTAFYLDTDHSKHIIQSNIETASDWNKENIRCIVAESAPRVDGNIPKPSDDQVSKPKAAHMIETSPEMPVATKPSNLKGNTQLKIPPRIIIPAKTDFIDEADEEEEEEKEQPQPKTRDLSVFQPINEEEFNKVPKTTRGRCTLKEANDLYSALFKHFKAKKNSKPLTLEEMASMGLKVSGQTGECRMQALRQMKLLSMSKNRYTVNFK